MGEHSSFRQRFFARPARFVFRDDRGAAIDVVRRKMTDAPAHRVGRRVFQTALPVVIAIGAVVFSGLGLAGPLIGAVLFGDQYPGWTKWGLILGIGAGVAVTSYVLWLLAREWLARLDWELLTARRADGGCGQCGFSLRGLPAGADGLVDCPECNTRWRPTTGT